MESAGSEIRLYRASGSGLVELARLSGVAPPRAVEGDLRAPEIGGDYGDGDAAGAGLFVALIQGGVIVDIARLLFVGGEPSDPDGGPDCYSGSNRSSSGDKSGSSGSTGKGEEISSKVTGKALPALSVSVGGLMVDAKDEEWVNPSKWDGEGEEDWKGNAKGHYSGSNRSSSGDKPGSSGSTGEEEEEEISSKVTGKALPALSVSVGGLMADAEDEEWVDPSKWDGKGEEDWKGNANGHVRSSSWRSATEDSVSNFLEQPLEEGSSSKNTLRITSNFWRSGSSESSTEEEGQSQEPDQEGEEDWVFDDKEHLSDGTRSLSNSPRLATNESSSSRFNEALRSKKQVQASSGECESITDERGQDPEKDNKKEEKDAFQSMQIKLKLWPAQRHLLINVSFSKNQVHAYRFRFLQHCIKHPDLYPFCDCGGKWVLTKDCILTWLNLEDVNEYNLKVEFGASFATLLGFRNTDCTMDFEVDADCTPMLNDLMTLLKTSICNFQILKKVGEGDACKVFKCLFMGRKCALKSLAQENPWTLEPREVEIISSMKDIHVMVFYQAWIEPWAYNGQAEQEYLFIHLEFCPSTLKHALLYKNLHWFPKKWVLFEAIVRIVQKLHEASVVHRDLKPDNIFLNSDMVVRVGDFGDACIGADELGLYGRGTSNLGTRYYVAPELNSRGKVTEKVDIYSLSVIMFDIFSKFQTGFERNRIFPKLSKQGPHASWEGDRKLYDMMTSLEASDRPSTSEVLDYIHLHHLE